MTDSSIRINKYLSQCGVTSRRGADNLILEKRVSINGQLVEKPGARVDPELDSVAVDGKEVRPVGRNAYVLLNKPGRVLTTLSDPFKRRTVKHCLKNLSQRVYPVGRLDYDTEGVLLLTNDGELAHRLTHPKFQVEKIYEATVRGQFGENAGKRIEKGIPLEDGVVGRAKIVGVQARNGSSLVQLLLTEGRKREVKQLCAAVGHEVQRLRRLEFAGLNVNGLDIGQWRYLTSKEIEHLKSLVKLT